jgi:hypothetical protein
LAFLRLNYEKVRSIDILSKIYDGRFFSMATSFAEPAQQLSSEESNFFVLEGVRRDERRSHAVAPDLR